MIMSSQTPESKNGALMQETGLRNSRLPQKIPVDPVSPAYFTHGPGLPTQAHFEHLKKLESRLIVDSSISQPHDRRRQDGYHSGSSGFRQEEECHR